MELKSRMEVIANCGEKKNRRDILLDEVMRRNPLVFTAVKDKDEEEIRIKHMSAMLNLLDKLVEISNFYDENFEELRSVRTKDKNKWQRLSLFEDLLDRESRRLREALGIWIRIDSAVGSARKDLRSVKHGL